MRHRALCRDTLRRRRNIISRFVFFMTRDGSSRDSYPFPGRAICANPNGDSHAPSHCGGRKTAQPESTDLHVVCRRVQLCENALFETGAWLSVSMFAQGIVQPLFKMIIAVMFHNCLPMLPVSLSESDGRETVAISPKPHWFPGSWRFPPATIHPLSTA